MRKQANQRPTAKPTVESTAISTPAPENYAITERVGVTSRWI